MLLSRISKHLRRIDFLDLTVSSNVVSDIKFLPLGHLLRENISRERSSNQILRNESFDFHSFPANYLANSGQQLKRKSPLEAFHVLNFESGGGGGDDEAPGIALKSSKVLCSTSLVSSKHAFELFHQLQRQRKIWWMKFMYNPGQIVFSNPARTESSQTISISMKAAEGFHVELERIGLYSLPGGEGTTSRGSALQSWFSVDTAAMSFLIDALPEFSSNDKTMYLHRRLSPYKFILLAEDQMHEELRDLSKLVAYELTSSSSVLNVLNQVDSTGKLDENLLQSDQMGVPYCLILGRESLETGLIKLRSRNTTLSEVIHISDIPGGYLEQIIQG